ncbi:MAG: ester cyclase [Thermoleophilaceae bacterium]
MAHTDTTEQAKRRTRRPTRSKRAVEKVVRGYFDAMARRDPDAMATYWREDGVDEVVPVGVFRGPDAIRALFAEIMSAVPDLEMSVQRLVADTRQAAVEWRLTGTFDGGPFQGIDPTGRRVELRGLDLFEVEDGKLMRGTGYYDGAEFGRQVGMLPAQDSGAERAMKGALNAVTRVRKAVDERRGA